MSAATYATDPFSDPEPSAPPPGAPPAVEVRALYRGITTHARVLTFPSRPKARGGRHFTIGWQAGVDAPVAQGFVPWASHPLVLAAGEDYVVNVTPEMTGQVRERGQVYSLAAYTAGRGRTFALPAAGEATLDCGASRFVIARTEAPRALPPPPWRWSWQRHGYTLVSGLALVVLLVMIAFVPADPKSLALDIYGRDGRMLPALIKPPVTPEEEQRLEWLKKQGQEAGGQGSTAAGEAGAAGDKKAPHRDTRFSVRRRADENEVRLTKQQAADIVRSAGILGVFRRVDSTPLNAILRDEKAMGDSAEDVLGHIVGATIASAYGPGGLSVVGTGAGGGDTGVGLLGHGGLDTIGRRGAATGPGSGWERGVGALRPKRAAAVIPDMGGIASVRGALDKSIIRRVIRLHMNEMKYCYDQELTRNPSLGGRVVVHFAISGQGQVLTSALQSSTMGNTTVENCMVQAVKRWPFPAPDGGGLVLVSYPFVLAPAGG
jgi:hypothetical protein